MSYFQNILLGLDQWANTIIGGSPDETISARAGRLRKRQFWKQLAWTLDKLQKNHTDRAIEHEYTGSQQDATYKDLYEAYQAAKAAQKAAKETVEKTSAAVEVAKDNLQ